jgi:glycosyltransferase involved in cell wall biosynthesis
MRILQVFRTPVGGLFRHVRDLTRGLAEEGHDVGIVCDSTTGGEAAARLLATAEPHCRLGIHRIPISRLPGLGDLSGVRQTAAIARAIKPGIIHCHGAKGGLYGRLAAKRLGLPSVYTPHGGSLHYEWSSPSGAIFLAAEKLLVRAGSGFHFVCNFERDAFEQKIGTSGKPSRVIYNGLWPGEFTPVIANADTADVLYIGDMRRLKGVDLLIDALAILNRERPITACLVGDGAELEQFRTQVRELGLANAVSFPGRLSASEAFRLGRVLVMPSRHESFPYVVLEACAAGVPILASRVGGIPEVLPEDVMFRPGDAAAIAARLKAALADAGGLRSIADQTRQRLARDFTASAMVKEALRFYRDLGAT